MDTFQSTLPSQGATELREEYKDYGYAFQSTLPSQGATLMMTISKYGLTFQSTLPSQGATIMNGGLDRDDVISIHAPLTGSDNKKRPYSYNTINFNPRSPHRERLTTIWSIAHCTYFNPRSPHRERRN